MTIKDQIRDKAVDKIFAKLVNQYRTSPAWAWRELREAAKTIDIEEIKQITDATANIKLIREHLRELAETEADQLLADDALDLNELNRIFG